MKPGSTRKSIGAYRVIAVLAIVAATGVATAIGSMISNQLNATVTAGSTATLAWDPAPASPVGVGQANTFAVDLTAYTGTSTSPMHLNLVVTDACADVVLVEGGQTLTGTSGTGTCTYETSAKGPTAPQTWSFTVTYVAAGSYSWTVIAHQS